MDERVLITGGAGFIGLHLARALVARGVEVTLVDNFFRATQDHDLRALLPHVRLIEYDLTQPIDAEVVGSGYTQVYHLAAIVGVRYSNEVPRQVLRTNLLTTMNILDWCATQKQIQLCFASTSEVYAGAVSLGQVAIPTPETAPLTITDPSLPRWSYALSKITGELLCFNYARDYELPLRIVRYHNVYGPRMGYEHVIPQFIERVIQQRNPFPVYGALQSRAYCYVDDAVTATLQCMNAPITAPLVVNIGNDQEEIQSIDLAKKLFAITGFAPELELHPPSPGSPDRRCPDLMRLHQLTGYQPTVDLEQGLRQTYDWYQRVWLERSALV